MNVLDLVGRHVELRRTSATRGGEYTGPCPGCGDGGKGGASDRFHVWPADRGGEGSYWCRRCEKAGDAIQFLRDFEGKSYAEACAALGVQAAAAPPAPMAARVSRSERAAFVPKPNNSPAELWGQKAEQLVETAHERIHSQPAALQWLAGRGIDSAGVDRFRLGWIDQPVFRPRKSWGLDDEFKADGTPKKLFIPRGILIPSTDASGAVFRLRVRRPKEDIDEQKQFAKYYVVPGSQAMSLVIGEQSLAFVVVETELDAMMLACLAGDLVGAVATGSSSTKPDDRTHAILSRAAAILVALDDDAAGASAWRFWADTYPEAERWPVSIGKDPGEAFEKGLDLRTWLLAGLPPAWRVWQETPRRRQAAAPAAGKKAEALPAADECLPDTGADLPATVRELGALLARLPVRIVSTANRMAIEQRPGWTSNPDWRRISDLVFFDPACWAYLSAHPLKVIDGDNFFLTTVGVKH